MKRLLVALAFLAWAAPAPAQEARPAFGVGVAINALGAPDVAPTVEVYVPMRVAPNLRIEPSLGIRTVNRPSAPGNQDERDVTVGVGVFLLSRVSSPVDVYAGGRLKLNFAKKSFFGGTSDSGTDVSIAAALGGENYLSPHFSVGLEGELGYYNNSSASFTGEEDGLFTTGLVFVRVYFR